MDYSSKVDLRFRKINHFAYRCIMLGEHRPLIADLLREHSKKIISSYAVSGAATEKQGVEDRKDTSTSST